MNKKFAVTFSALVILIVLASLLSLHFGVVSISPSEVFQTFIGNGSAKQELVLFQIRLPSIILAILIGAGMAISGAILQAITNNDLADPGILGINSGAGLAVVLYIAFFQQLGSNVYLLPMFAFVGALLTAVLIVALAWKGGFQSIRLVLVGIGVNAGLGALLIAFQLKMNPIDFMKAVVWLSGDLWATQWKYVWALLPWYIVLIPFALYKAKSLNVLTLGDSISTGLGINVAREKLILLVLAVAFAGLGVSCGGGIAFLGLIAPHIARRLVGAKHGLMLPVAAMLGAVILLLADTIGRNIVLPAEIPAGIVVSLISAPYFIYLLMRSK
ncbi:FecCD family ABC transporter permease [Peribacillus faecalis]|uniref:FecCD family ABC transporter permease n=1 Tax=Peribacillus faecalis TaxID=2772559 RepID=UPI0019D6FDB6|nr:iron ABC transporter permease [Peribacillus faecalis]